jgi:predicted transcriptional regulator
MSVILAKPTIDPQILQLENYTIKRITSLQSHKYDNTEKIVKCLADFQSRIILFSIINEGKTAEEIAYSAKLPLSSVYKKLRDLEEMTLVQIERRDISDNGRKFKIYRSRISAANISIKRLEAKIRLLPNRQSCD